MHLFTRAKLLYEPHICPYSSSQFYYLNSRHNSEHLYILLCAEMFTQKQNQVHRFSQYIKCPRSLVQFNIGSCFIKIDKIVIYCYPIIFYDIIIQFMSTIIKILIAPKNTSVKNLIVELFCSCLNGNVGQKNKIKTKIERKGKKANRREGL